MRRFARTAVTASLMLGGGACLAQSPPSPPTCRLDAEGAAAAAKTIGLALKAYAELGTPLPINDVVANPESAQLAPKTLGVYVLSDASTSSTTKERCIRSSPALVKGEELDAISVREGCVAASDRLEVRCSSNTVQLFGKQGNRPGLANPALLYLLAHELWHIKQRRPGEYAGRVELIDMRKSREEKLQTLQASCEPGLTRAEEDADRNAVRVLERLLPALPYREALFSPQGSVLWGADQLNIAANTWRKEALEREFISQPKPHKSFVPTEFPTLPETVKRNANSFVCDVLTKRTGVVAYPGRSSTHPPLEMRMQRVAEALRFLAAGLPKASAKEEYKPVAVLQEQLSDIFTFMYRETGVYLEAVQSAICTKVNGDHPAEGCGAR
ncbi:hypothetical protein [Derxia lacustris]|uniref:hypothetical protein n=1 Tax=Derxia lacustris TaxID=764842 RepID=UPI00111BE0AB|nr:hypothetical protein [Derxia lacustris]